VVRAKIVAMMYFLIDKVMVFLRVLKAAMKSKFIEYFTVQVCQLLKLLVREPRAVILKVRVAKVCVAKVGVIIWIYAIDFSIYNMAVI
jgi:hypothetical protein